MNQELEIEFKNILTSFEFAKLSQYAGIVDEAFFTQENHYFDTKNFALKKQGCALRIRSKNGTYEMTLKQPAKEGLLESNQKIEVHEATAAIQSDLLPKGEIIALIHETYGIHPHELCYFGSLITHRAETEYEEGTLVLDHSEYLGEEDYELEYEVADYQKGKISFENLLEKLNIPLRPTDNKIKRFYLAKLRKMNS
ncbi:CYTH domain-containing protein [Bacillus sp. 1P06AnD]|uniref:CYTH domain-containing protein n=1 Tax=Bacillus sp. 1P06AnD TaxID=3132208 RepID=UPI0039A23C49